MFPTIIYMITALTTCVHRQVYEHAPNYFKLPVVDGKNLAREQNVSKKKALLSSLTVLAPSKRVTAVNWM